ncbi:MAG: GIY-YIG nuclease family protein [Clostridia bacterium]|nr:GIY-YIG nuclease family protein [Clostridia bacterium]
MKGYIYILTNPSFRDWVKIGYADNVEERVKQLNSKECTPFAFRIYATYEVNSRLMDKKIHTIIDILNRNLRSIDEYNGQRRVREFFAISPEDAYAVFKAMAEINDCPERLKKWELSTESIRDEELAENVAEEMEIKRQVRCANWTFDSWNIPVGAVLINVDNPDIKCTVIDNKSIEYNGEIMSMTRLAKLVSGKESTSHGPGYVSRHFKYNDELIKDIEERI